MKRDLRGIFSKEVLIDRVANQIKKEEGVDFTYSINNNQAVIVTNNYQGKNAFDYEIIVEKNLYESLQKLGIVPKINWN